MSKKNFSTSILFNVRNWSLIPIVIGIGILFSSCEDAVLPKPKAFLRLDYPEVFYQKIISDCPYTIEISQESTIKFENNCWAKINYPKMNATIHLTYRSIDENLNLVLQEVERLTFDHTIKADVINAQPFSNEQNRVYGKIINVEGNTASNIQFHMTDSIKNMLYGTLYFNVKPNYDSILPAVNYIEKDIRNLMESIVWKN